MSNETLANQLVDSLNPTANLVTPARPDIEQLKAALARATASKSAPGEIQELRHILEQFPHIYRNLGNLSSRSQIAIACSITTDILDRESILLVASELEENLSRPDDTALEKILVEQCVSAYMHHYDVELEFNRSGIDSRNNVWDTRVNESQKRFLRALQALAHFRQLAVPTVQINIAETQTNLAQTL